MQHRSRIRRLCPTVLLAVLALPLAALPASAAKRPTCDGKRANIVGTGGRDSFSPGKFEEGDVVAMLGGSDFVEVGDHVDDITICGGKGDDFILGDARAGEDLHFFGDSGADYLGSDELERARRAMPHPLKLDGGRGNDHLTGSKGHDRIEGDSGFDIVRASTGDDVVHGGEGDDDLSGGAGNDLLFGDQDDDHLYGFDEKKKSHRRQVDSAFGGPGHDLCVAKHRHSCKKDQR